MISTPRLQKLRQAITYLKTNHLKKTIFGIVVILLVVLVSIGKSGDSFSLPYQVTTGDIIDQVMLSGRTESMNSVDLGFADSGRVNRVYVTEGQNVTKGQVLAELEMGDLQAQLTSARAGLTIARANLSQTGTSLEKVTTEQNQLVETARRALFGGLEAYPEDVFSTLVPPTIVGSFQGTTPGEYRLDLYASSADTGFSVRYSGLEQGTASFTTGSRSPLGTQGLFMQFPDSSEYAKSEWTIPIPNDRSANYTTLLNAYQTAQATRDRTIQTAQTELLGDGASVLQARVDQARAQVDQILSAMDRRKIVAPFSGTISRVVLKEGESTVGISKETSPGVSMLVTDQYKVVIKIPEIDVARVTANASVHITLDAYGPDVVFNGTLATINPAETIVDGVPVYEGTVLFDTQDERIRSGMTATVKIVIGEKQNVLTIPGNYIREDKVLRKYFVSLPDPENSKKTLEREVSIGIRGSDNSVEITQGLAVGETIVITE